MDLGCLARPVPPLREADFRHPASGRRQSLQIGSAMERQPSPDEIGAHVSAAGGVSNAPGRAAELDTAVLQLFTKQGQRWKEPELTPEITATFRAEREAHGVVVA